MKNLTYKININSNAARFDTGGGGNLSIIALLKHITLLKCFIQNVHKCDKHKNVSQNRNLDSCRHNINQYIKNFDMCILKFQ
mgnify:CR=1 FL=1